MSVSPRKLARPQTGKVRLSRNVEDSRLSNDKKRIVLMKSQNMIEQTESKQDEVEMSGSKSETILE